MWVLTYNFLIVDSKNYMNALKWVDYLIIDEDKISNRMLNEFSEKLKMPMKEL
jgi:hypothetical protein